MKGYTVLTIPITNFKDFFYTLLLIRVYIYKLDSWIYE